MTLFAPSTDRLATSLLRIAEPEWAQVKARFTGAAAHEETGCFASFGWRPVPNRLVVSLAALHAPQAGEIEGAHDRVGIVHPYLRRVVQDAAKHRLAIGFIHNHPRGMPPVPSSIDDEMDGYLAEYLADFLPGRPFVSLIFSTVDEMHAVSGRIFFDGNWTDIGRVSAERDPALRAWPSGRRPDEPPLPPESVARMTSAFGREAFERLNRATVAVIGAGGTGSAAIPILARAGVGKLVVVDGDHATISNLERLHGSRPSDIPAEIPKAAIARRAVAEFAPDVDVEAIVGRLPQDDVLDAVVQADLILGCTDQHSSRLAVADIATRYAIPAIDCGGLIEGADGIVTGQLVQIVRFLAADPCPRCRGMISETRVAQEMLPTHARLSQLAQAELAVAAGERPDPILTAIPQIDTVGYITTTAGTLAAGFAIGWLTGRFSPRFERLQLDLVSDCLGAVERPQRRQPGCSCGRIRGHADQAQAYAPVVPPDHWPPVRRL